MGRPLRRCRRNHDAGAGLFPRLVERRERRPGDVALARRWRGGPAALSRRGPGSPVHGTTVRWHPATTDGWLIVDAVDGHATGARGPPLTVTVADCVPVYLAVPQKQVVALLHAGWRGTAGGILERGVGLVERMAFVRSAD